MLREKRLSGAVRQRSGATTSGFSSLHTGGRTLITRTRAMSLTSDVHMVFLNVLSEFYFGPQLLVLFLWDGRPVEVL
jgi:hypothetical protein